MADVVNLINQIKLKDDLIHAGIDRIVEYKVDREISRIKG